MLHVVLYIAACVFTFILGYIVGHTVSNHATKYKPKHLKINTEKSRMSDDDRMLVNEMCDEFFR